MFGLELVRFIKYVFLSIDDNFEWEAVCIFHSYENMTKFKYLQLY